MTSLIKAIQERLAKICDTNAQINLGQKGANPRDPYVYEQGIGCEICAKAIRAADLSDLEPKEGETLRVDAAEIVNGTRYVLQPRAGFPDMTALARQLERELATLTARLEAKEAECEALRRDAQRVDWLEEVRPNIYFKVGHVYKNTQAIEIEWSNKHSFIYTDGETLRAAIDAAKDSHE